MASAIAQQAELRQRFQAQQRKINAVLGHEEGVPAPTNGAATSTAPATSPATVDAPTPSDPFAILEEQLNSTRDMALIDPME